MLADRGNNFLNQRLPFLKPAEIRIWHHQQEAAMSLASIIIALIVVGILLWLINNYLPMDGKIKSILNGVVVFAVILWLLRAFGVLGSLSDIRI